MPVKSHPDCPVCQRRIATRKAIRRRWRSRQLCVRCGSPCRRYVACRACRERDNAQKRARAAAQRQGETDARLV